MVTTFAAWDQLDPEARLQTARHIAAALGPEWSAVDKLRGRRELAAVLHVPSSTEFVAVPGGTYIAGVRPEELELMRTIEFSEDSANEWLDEISESAPPTEATVKPLLVARAPLLTGRARELGADVGWVVGDDKSDFAPIRFGDEQTEPILEQIAWRLPTSIEWEWIAREGGTTPFINGSTFEEAEADRAARASRTGRRHLGPRFARLGRCRACLWRARRPDRTATPRAAPGRQLREGAVRRDVHVRSTQEPSARRHAHDAASLRECKPRVGRAARYAG